MTFVGDCAPLDTDPVILDALSPSALLFEIARDCDR